MNVNLLTIKLPITAIVSVLHRITGVIIFLSLPVTLWLLQQSLISELSFIALKQLLLSDVGKSISWLVLTAFFFHVVAGCRHLLMDLGLGESKCVGIVGARLTIVTTGIISSIIGVWIW
ncbi:MAG: succinate dehydrogenase, cytochrome b556 subunit [Legionellales bacterium]|nr:MAG: succinate dehydrogenase, cytochrome b556 subunit [Legionellales bacterium]